MGRSRGGPGLLRALVPILALAGCASDPAIQRWVERWHEVERQHEAGAHAEAIDGFRRLGRSAQTPVDHDMVELRQAVALERAGRPAEAFALLGEVADRARRLVDRARARLAQAGLAEAHGHLEAARRIHRRVVLTYPESMPGLRSLQHLERLAEEAGPQAVEAHLRWSLDAYEVLHRSTLGDNLLFYAALVAYRRWRDGGAARLATIAEQLLSRVHQAHFASALWDEAMWHLSWLYHRQERFDDEIAIIRRVQGTRELATFIGSYDTPYYWVGQLRIARVELLNRERPAAAAQALLAFVEDFPQSRWRDDALYWAGCAWLRAGRLASAESAFARIPRVYAESKYLRRLDAARAAPESEICDPREFEEGEW